MRVLQVASEATPFAKTGGLADVAGAPVDVIFTPHLLPLDRGIVSTIHAELADGSLYARDNALALQRTQRAADIDAELMAALERWELLGN
jgi:hypothetical protein